MFSMIPSVRNRIDMANRVIANENGTDSDNRVSIPPEEIEELSELRKGEYVQRAREEHAERVAEAEVKANLMEEHQNAVDLDREFGLPHGMACIDIWEKILSYIDDPEDILRISPTCQVFWNILKGKYKAVRLTEVALLLRQKNDEREMNEFLDLRLVCHSSKVAVDKLFLRDTLEARWYEDTCYDRDSDWMRQWIPKPEMIMGLDSFHVLHNLLSCPELHKVGVDSFPLRTIHYYELWSHQNNPLLVEQRTRFELLLGRVGSSVRTFQFTCCEDNFGTYNQLRKWIVLMPNIVELEVIVHGEPFHPHLPAPARNQVEVELQPFPHCPKLKRFTNHSGGFFSPFLTEVFRANPGISDIFYFYDDVSSLFPGWGRWEGDECGAVLRALDFVHLERFVLYAHLGNPKLQFLEFRFGWPLKHLTLTIEGADEWNPLIPSRTLFAFINSFSMTLEEVIMTWKIRDTGGYLDVPKVSKLLWKFWPEFANFDFMVALENLQFLDVDIRACPEINEDSIREKNLPGLFPGLKKIRSRLAWEGQWTVVWKS